jgi:hypothetical protein
VWLIENATTGSQIITIKQGSGGSVNVANGSKVMIVTDGLGAGAAVINANPTEAGAGTVTSVGGTGTVNGITLTGTVTSSGNLTLGGTLGSVDLTSQITGTLPVANGGTNSTNINAARQEIALPALADVHTSTPATLVDGQYCVAGAGSITFTLPASPAIGDSVIIKDGTGAAATTSFTVARNGSNIASSATDLTFDKNFAEITLTYIDGTIGWSV